jgi:hypothetical protein
MTAVGDAAELARPGEAIYQAAQRLEKNAAPGPSGIGRKSSPLH